MGNHSKITHDCLPQQGRDLGKPVQVVFHYNTDHPVSGKIVRDDYEDPWTTIIALEDGRYVLAAECQYRPL